MSTPNAERLDAYIAAFEALTPDGLDVFDGLCTPDVRFVDPFNDVHGLGPLKAVFRHMFETLSEPRFRIIDRACGGRAGYIRWHFSFTLRGEAMTVDGMSEVLFDPDGRVTAHIDHWDASTTVYGRLPLIGAVIRWVRRRLSAG